MSIIVPQDVEVMVARQLASGRYQSDQEVLRSAMLALEEMDEDFVAIQEAVDNWRRGVPGTPLADAFRQIRESGPGGMHP
jgi:putative addiction module CopG family antidote